MDNVRLGTARILNKVSLVASYAAMRVLEDKPIKPIVKIPVKIESDNLLEKLVNFVKPVKPIVIPVQVIEVKRVSYFNPLESRYEFF